MASILSLSEAEGGVSALRSILSLAPPTGGGGLPVVAPTYRSLLQGVPAQRAIFPMGEASGTTVSDISSAGLTGTIVGGVTLGQPGIAVNDVTTAAVFNGSTGTIMLPAGALDFEGSDVFSVEALFIATSAGSSGQEQFIISKELNSGTYAGWSLGLANTSGILGLEFLLSSVSGPTVAVFVKFGTVSLNTPHKVKVTSDGTGTVAGITAWLDGVPQALSPQRDSLAGNTIKGGATAYIGSRSGTGGFFTGKIQYIAINGITSPNGTTSSHDGYAGSRPYDIYEPLFYQFGVQGRAIPADPPSVPNVIFDDDMYDDCDGAMDLAILCAAHKQGKINLIGAVASSVSNTSAPCMRAIMDHYGISAPVYAYKGSDMSQGTDRFTPGVTSRFRSGDTRANYVDDLTGYRALLAANTNVIIVATGPAKCLARLLASPANANSDGLPSGAALISGSVKYLVWAAGFAQGVAKWGVGTESNIGQDSTSATTIAASWPTPVVQSGVEASNPAYSNTAVGLIAFKPAASLDPTTNPMKYAYDLYVANGGQVGSDGTRPFYSGTAIMFAVEGTKNNLVGWGGIGGTETINTSTGADTWSTAAGSTPWSYLVKRGSNASINTWAAAKLGAYA